VGWTADLDLIAGKIMRRAIRGQSAETIETEEAEKREEVLSKKSD
jgi:hypothetical protein